MKMLSSADVSRIQYSLSGVRCVSLCKGIHGVSAVLPQHQLLVCHNPSSPLGHGKGRVPMVYPNPEACNTKKNVPESQVAPVETSINTTMNRYAMCTHPTGGNSQYVPKPRLWYYLGVLSNYYSSTSREGLRQVASTRMVLVRII